MEALKFKTNIKCAGCLAKVMPALNTIAGEDNWEVDITTPEKILTVMSDASANEVIATLKESGFVAELK